MLPVDYNGEKRVLIRKGLMTFDALIKSLHSAFSKYDVNPTETPIIMHFRISTQGGVQKELCHPYPVCGDYDKMRSLACLCNIGLCHNGIISRCSVSRYSYSHYDYKTKQWIDDHKQPNYNDTMTFIKDYASLIIDNDQKFYEKPNKVQLLERLCEYSKLAIMNASGEVKLIGNFQERNGIYYSNLYHEVSINTKADTKKPSDFKSVKDFLDDCDDYGYGGVYRHGYYDDD